MIAFSRLNVANTVETSHELRFSKF